MNNKLFSLFLLTAIFAVGFASAATLSQWNLTTDGSASNINSNINAGGFTASGVTLAFYSNGDGAYASGWESSLSTSKYFQITIAPKTGYNMVVDSINFGEMRSATGPATYQVQWAKTSNFSSATTIGTYTSVITETIKNLSTNIPVNNGETLYIRFFPYDSTGGTWSITDNTLNIAGTVSAVSTSATNYCKLGEKGTYITIKKVSDEQKDNKNEWEWRPMDNIEITVEIENNDNNYDLDGIIEYGLYDTEDKDFIFEDEINFDVDAEEEDEFTITFQIDPTELNQDTSDGSYQFYIKVYDDDDYDEQTQCKQFIQNVEIKRNKDEVTLESDKVKILPEQVGCGSEIEFIADLYNIGTEDQEGVYVMLYNKELGLNIKQEVGDIDATEKQNVRFTFEIPPTAEEKTYSLELMIFNEDDNFYEIEDHKGDDKEARFFYTLNVNGDCLVKPKATITATLESGTQAGKEIVVKVIVKNDDSKTVTYTLGAKDYESWASLREITSTVLVLKAGESAEVTYKLGVNKDTIGEQTFNILVKTGETDKETLAQPVSVTIEESKGFSFPGISGSAIAGDNWYLWGIGILNVVLIIIIIIVAVRVARS